MTSKEIALVCYGILEEATDVTAEKRAEKRTATFKTFYEAMEMTSNEVWEMTDGNIPHIYFYREEECDPILQEGEPPENEDDNDNDDDLDMSHYYEWRNNIYEARLKKAAEWLFLRQSAIQKCHKLGLRPFVAIDIEVSDLDYIELPSQFITACGQADLPIVIGSRKALY